MGTVYFLQAEGDTFGPVKIGYTDRPVKFRRAEAQTFNHQRVMVLADVSGSEADEDALHKLFESHRLRGEWFTYAIEIQELVLYLTVQEGTLRSWLEGRDISGGNLEPP